MKFFLFLFVFNLIHVAGLAQSIDQLGNNKELISREISRKEVDKATAWAMSLGIKKEELNLKAKNSLKEAINILLKNEANCDLGFPQFLKEEAKKSGLIATNEDFDHYIVFLRKENIIDDIFYKIIKNNSNLLKRIEITKDDNIPLSPLNLYNKKNKNINITELYQAFKNPPDDIHACTLNAYAKISKSIFWRKKNDRNRQMKRLNYIAYKKGVITHETFNKLTAIRKEKVLDWTFSIVNYLSIIYKAKDKLTKDPERSATNKFTSTYVSRRLKLTKRDRLYALYNPTQVIMLSGIIERTAKRIDARKVEIDFQLEDDPEGERDNYVLSPMEKYRLSINMLKKEMAEAMRSENFAGVPIKYEDLVTAAFETGYIKSEELDYIIKFEEFWNPKQPQWKTYVNFAFSLAGTASLYLPPPWNIVGAIALVVTQSNTINKKKKGNPDDSWNSII